MILAVYVVPALRGLSGVKVAMRPVALSRTTDAAVTGTGMGDGPATVKVAVLIMVGSIRIPEGTLKVALMAALLHTPVPFALGLVDSTETFAGAAGPAVVKVHT